MKKYIVMLLSSVLSVHSFPANAYYDDDVNYGDYQDHYEYREHGRPRQYFRWHCDPYSNVCYKVYYHRWPKKHNYKNTEPKHVFVAPPEKIAEKNIVKINLTHGTWGAYDSEGSLVNSGHISGGKSFCPDIGKKCKTATGTFTVYEKRGSNCKSKIFPVGKGGAPMPYCMFFYQGYAMHGSNSVPNYNASHGCVRMSPKDAKWLNENFVKVGSTKVNVTYDNTASVDDQKKDKVNKKESANKKVKLSQ
ncbi:MAG: L,D-transpeptidase [Candidatus Berkiella sp.]